MTDGEYIKKNYKRQLKQSEKFLEELVDVLEKSPKLKELWDGLQFFVLDPGAFQDDVMDALMIAYEC
jgi:hypothetical protein